MALMVLAMASCASVRPAKPSALGAATWTSYDGKEMPWKEWPVPKGTPVKGVIITVHGLSGASSDFWPLGKALPPQGWWVYGYELRGQGNDPDLARRGDIGSADQWLKDLTTFHKLVKACHPGLPIIWYGESLGTLITLHAATRGEAAPDALVMATPIAGLRKKVSVAERCLLLTGSRIVPGLHLKLGDLAGVDENKIRVTSTTTHGGQMEVTPHHVPAFTLRLLREIDRLMSGNARAAARVSMPVLMLGSPYDVVSAPDQVQHLFGQLHSPDKRLYWYTRSYHLLLHDVQRDEVVGDFSKWLVQHVARH